MWIEIKPLDTLFFRDGKPFNAGEDTWANSMFPPNPSVIWGTIFSYILSNVDEACKNELLNVSKPEDFLKIKNIFIYEKKAVKRVLLPTPLDIFKDKNQKKCVIPTYEKNNMTSSLLKYNICLPKNKQVESVENSLIDIDSLYLSYFKLYYNELTVLPYERVLVKDNKIGIKRSSASHSSEEGCLYRFDNIQLKDNIRFVIELESKFQDNFGSNLLKIGGEGKSASIIEIADSINIFDAYKDIPEDWLTQIAEKKQFRLYISTPAIFKQNGWYPDFLDKDFISNGSNSIPQYSLKLIAASVGKSLSIGGFDMKLRSPKPMYKAVPAGSVFVFQINKGITEEKIFEMLKSINNNSISTIDPDKGYGLSRIFPC